MDKGFGVGQEIPFGAEMNPQDKIPQESQFPDKNLSGSDIPEPKKSNTSILTIALVVLTVFSVSGAVALYVIKEAEVNKRLEVEATLEATQLAKEQTEKELKDTIIVKDQFESDLTQTRQDFKKTLSELAEKEEELAKKEKQIDDTNNMVASLNASLSKKDKEQEKLDNKFKEANRDLQHLKVQLSQIRMAKESLENRIIQLSRKKSANTVELEKIVVGDDSSGTQKKKTMIPNPEDQGHYISLPPPASLEGQVLVVNKEFAFVVINIGQKDGLEESKILEVYRGQNYLGKVQVERIYDTMSSAVILPEYTTEEIKEGDAVKQI
ncbi:MAG: hypothetical protein ABII88_10095 [Candidatus Omnitrophota bacterium]